MKNNQKGFVNMVLIGVIATLVIVGGYFVWSKKFQQPSNQPVSTTTNWKTYTNTQYGFEFKYPSIYTIKTSDKSTVPGELFLINLLGPEKGQSGSPRSSMGIVIWDNPQKLSLLDWASVKDNASFSNYSNSVTNFKNEIVSRHKAISYSWMGMYDGKTVLIENNKTILLLDTSDKTDRVWQDFDSVLSTFKLTK